MDPAFLAGQKVKTGDSVTNPLTAEQQLLFAKKLQSAFQTLGGGGATMPVGLMMGAGGAAGGGGTSTPRGMEETFLGTEHLGPKGGPPKAVGRGVIPTGSNNDGFGTVS
jgi:hypothetical protein